MGVESITSPLPGFDPWTVQLVVNHYTNYAIPAHTFYYMSRNTVRRYRVCVVQHFKGVMWYKVNCWCKGLKFLGVAGLIFDEASMTTAVLREKLVRPHCSWRMMLLLETHIYIGLKFSHVIVYSPFYAPGTRVSGQPGQMKKWFLRTFTVPFLRQNCPSAPMTTHIVWMCYDH